MTTVVTLHQGADPQAVRAALQALGQWAQPLSDGDGGRAAFALAAHSQPVAPARLYAVTGVAEVLAGSSGHPLLDTWRGRAVPVTERLAVGPGAAPVLLAGPCGAESAAQVHAAAAAVAAAGGAMLRGGAYKPRTSPYAFAGVGRQALTWLRQAADRHGLGLVTECLSEADVDAVADVADLVQIGSRNMQNFALLRAVGATGRPVLLKRGAASTLSEWRLAAEHALAAGAKGVVFCERGIRGLDPETRNTLDLGAVALLALVDELAVVVDPSHAAGRRDLVAPLSRAALAAGAHGLLVETHPDPASARSDGAQALSPAALATLLPEPRP